jgi:hypothetical protein
MNVLSHHLSTYREFHMSRIISDPFGPKSLHWLLNYYTQLNNSQHAVIQKFIEYLISHIIDTKYAELSIDELNAIISKQNSPHNHHCSDAYYLIEQIIFHCPMNIINGLARIIEPSI